MSLIRWMLLFGVIAFAATAARADSILIDFEGLSDLDSVTTQFPGLTFSNTIILSAGLSLNEFDFPPSSDINVVSDDGGPITIVFDTPALSFAGYFTYVVPVTIEAFDSSDSSVALASSLFSENDGFTGELGSSPNELLQVSHSGGISRIVISGDSFGGSFTLDDVSVVSAAVPEPSTVALMLLTLPVVVLWGRHHLMHYKR